MDQPPSQTASAAAASQLLISAGLPKSGSTWLYNLQNALGEAAGWGPWQEVQQGFFPEHSWFPYVEDLRPVRLVWLLLPVLHGRSYCIKVHCPPHPAGQAFAGLDSLEKAVEFVKALVPSAVVTQRHMGALSFNVQQLQVHDALYILQGSFMLCRVPCLPLRSVKCLCH